MDRNQAEVEEIVTAPAASKCRHRRQLALVVLAVSVLFAAWTWIGVVAYQRWGNKPSDITQPDQAAFGIAMVLVWLASLAAVRSVLAKAQKVRDEQNTCPQCRQS